MAVIKTVQEESLVALGDAIREKAGTSEPLVFPTGMVEAIEAIKIGGPEVEPIVLTGQCDYTCAGLLGGKYIDLHGNSITTDNLTSVQYMFYECSAEKIPFELNFGSNLNAFLHLFEYADIKTLPKMNHARSITQTFKMFYGCSKLTSIPDEYAEKLTWSNTGSTNQRTHTFTYCTRLRYISPAFLKGLCGSAATSITYSPYYYLLTNNSVLDEAREIGVGTGTITSNLMTYIIGNNYHLKSFTFETNDDGTPKTAKWKNQSLSFSAYIGRGGATTYFTNNGLSADKEVKDDATYQALKNDPDWWTIKTEYCRYNHDSAVETINSLPDASAYLATAGGTNTIKFTGAAGSATDGGACNTLTEEEIAVATAKGWTVSFI